MHSKKNAFLTLAKSITGQQISIKAANSIWNKLEKRITNLFLSSSRYRRTNDGQNTKSK